MKSSPATWTASLDRTRRTASSLSRARERVGVRPSTAALTLTLPQRKGRLVDGRTRTSAPARRERQERPQPADETAASQDRDQRIERVSVTGHRAIQECAERQQGQHDAGEKQGGPASGLPDG